MIQSSSLHRRQVLHAGNGSQWPRMGADLLAASPSFQASVGASAAAAAALGVDILPEFSAAGGFSRASRAGVGIIAVQAWRWTLPYPYD